MHGTELTSESDRESAGGGGSFREELLVRNGHNVRPNPTVMAKVNVSC